MVKILNILRGSGPGRVLALLVAATLSAEASAQSGETEYCYAGNCYDSLSQAEAAMDQANPLYAGLFALKSGSTGSSVVGLKPRYLTYGVSDQPASAFEPLAFNASNVPNPAPSMCSASSNARYPTMCQAESDLIQGLIASYQNAHGASSRVEHDIQGNFANPYFSSSGFGTPQQGQLPHGQLTHGLLNSYAPGRRLLNVRIFNANGVLTWAFTHEIFKISSYVCRSGFVGITGRHPAYADGTQTAVLSPPALCRATVNDQVITAKLRQTSCPVNANGNPALGKNPCYPATGDKARFETDFEFSGRPFTRSYHSLRQAGQIPELAPGWVHSYSDRVEGNPGYLSEPLIWTTDEGYVEIFKRVGSSNRFVSEGNAGNVLDVEPSNSLPHKFTITSGGMLVRRFDTRGRLLTVEDPESAWRISLTYQGERLIALTDQSGRQLLFDYQGMKLSTIHLPEGGAILYAYDAFGNIETVSYPDGTSKTYHYNEAGLSDAQDPHALTGITESGVRFSSYGYDAKGRVRLSQLHTATGPTERIQLAYSGDTQVTVTDQRGTISQYALSSGSGYRRVTGLTTPSGTTSQTYDGALVSEMRDAQQNVTRFEYAPDRSYVAVRYDAYGTDRERKTITTRDSSYRITAIEVQAKVGTAYVSKLKRSWTYNDRGQVLTATNTDPETNASRIQTKAYCEAADVAAGLCPIVGLIRSEDGPRTDVNDVTSFVYYQSDAPGCVPGVNPCTYRKGDLQAVTNALNQTIQILAYDDAGRPVQIIGIDGVVSEYEYDSRGRVKFRRRLGGNAQTQSDDQIWGFEYWPNGLLRKAVLPDGSFSIYDYDDAKRLIGISDNHGNQIAYELNGAGERTVERIKDPLGVLRRIQSRQFDSLGRVSGETDAYNRSTTVTFDANGNPDLTTDALGRVTDTDYDALNRMVRSLQDATGVQAEIKFSYDALDNLVQITDPKGLGTIYKHNAFAELVQVQSPDTGTTVFTYDAAGNRKSMKDARNKTTNYQYDALNRLTAITYPTAALNTTIAYDTAPTECAAGETFSMGRLSRMTDQSGSSSYCYDRFGNLVRRTQTINGKVFVLRYLYAVDGRLSKLIYPDGLEVDYSYDSTGRLSEVGVKTATGSRQVLLGNLSYYPFGPFAGWTYGNGARSRTMQRGVNLNYQPERILVPDGGLNLGFEFDEVGNLKRLKDANLSNPPSRVYNYDGLNRLIEARDGTSNALLHGYGYNSTGDRTSATVAGVATTYTYGTSNHRLASVGTSAARSYDANGNTTSIPGSVTKNFTFADHNRMSQYREGSTTKANYVYNGRGEQVRRYLGSSNTYSIYDDAGNWLGDYGNAGAGAPLQQAIWVDAMPVGVMVGAGASQKLYYVEPDALGSARVVVDPTRGTKGVVVWTWDLSGEPFGNQAPNQDPDGDGTSFVFNLRFPGQRFDSVSGLSYNMMRDYESATGRYVESDPIGLGGGINTYRYSEAAPLTHFDPMGLSSVSCQPMLSIPGGDEEVLRDRKLIHDTGWYLSSVRRNPIGPRTTPEGREAGANALGRYEMILGIERGVCWGKRVRTYQETYDVYDLTYLIEQCTEYDCATPRMFVRARTQRIKTGEYQKQNKDIEYKPSTQFGRILYFACLDWIKTLR